MVLPWKISDKPDNSLHKEPEKMFKDPVEIATFFQGFSPRKNSGRVYIKFRLHSPKRSIQIENHLDTWAQMNSYSLSKCIV